MPTRTPFRAVAPLALCTVLLSVSGSGCSFVFVDGPPTMHKQLPYFECTSSNALPTVDLVLGAVIGIGAGAELAASSGSTYSSGNNTGAAVAIGEAALFAASAIYGYQKTSSCREAKADLMLRLPRNPGYGPGFGPYAPPPPAVDPWVTPPTGAFAAPPPPPAAPAPPQPAAGGAAPTPPPKPTPPPIPDAETPK
jgi:hypothetical protein